MVHSFVGYTVPSSSTPRSGLSSNDSGLAGGAANSTAPPDLKAASCIASSSETFAIWLNVVYLAPLTYLFVKFFITSYLRRSNAESSRVKNAVDGSAEAKRKLAASSNNGPASLVATIANTEEEVRRRLSNVGNLAEKAGWDAAVDLEKEVYGNSAEAIESEPAEKAATTKKSKTKHVK